MLAGNRSIAAERARARRLYSRGAHLHWAQLPVFLAYTDSASDLGSDQRETQGLVKDGKVPGTARQLSRVANRFSPLDAVTPRFPTGTPKLSVSALPACRSPTPRGAGEPQESVVLVRGPIVA